MEAMLIIIAVLLVGNPVQSQPVIMRQYLVMWSATHAKCQDGVLHPSDNKSSLQDLASIMSTGEMYWVDGVAYNEGCENGTCDVSFVQSMKKKDHENMECVPGDGEAKPQYNCASLYTVSSGNDLWELKRTIMQDENYFIGEFKYDGVQAYCKAISKNGNGRVNEIFALCENCFAPICLKGEVKDEYQTTFSSRGIPENSFTNKMFSTLKPKFTINDRESSTMETSLENQKSDWLSMEATSISSTEMTSEKRGTKLNALLSSALAYTTTAFSSMSPHGSTLKTPPQDEMTPKQVQTQDGNLVVIVVVIILILLMTLTAIGVIIWTRRQNSEVKSKMKTRRGELPDFEQNPSIVSSRESVTTPNINPSDIFHNSLTRQNIRQQNGSSNNVSSRNDTTPLVHMSRP